MNKFNFLTWMGSFLIGIPIALVCIILLTVTINTSHVFPSEADNNTSIQVLDTVYVEKVVEKVKVDTFYIKTPAQPVKPTTPVDTL